MSTEPAAVDLSPAIAQRAWAWLLARRWTLVVWAGITAWSAVLFAVVRADHVGFRTARFDFGNMVQAVWSTAHGRPLDVTDGFGEQLVRLGGHVDPFLVLLTPLWWIAPTPLSLALAQVVAVALGALPVYWLGRRHLASQPAAACMALAYLAYPWTAWTASDLLHPVTFAIPLLLFAVWFLDGDRLWALAAVAVPAALTGELMGLTIAALGLWYALTRRRWRVGLTITAVATTWTLFAVEVILPAFAAGESSPYYTYYEHVGGSPAGVVRTAFTDPGAIVSTLTTSRDLFYVAALAAPLIGAFFLAPGLAAVAIPQLLVNGLADRASTTDPRHHYIAAIVPFLVAGTVLGVTKISRGRAVMPAALVLAMCVAWFAVFSPVPAERNLSGVKPLRESHLSALRAAVALVPENAPVTSTNVLGAHLSERRYVYSVPVLGRAEWAVIDQRNTWVPTIGRVDKLRPDIIRAFVRRLETDPRWTKVFESDGVLVYRRDA